MRTRTVVLFVVLCLEAITVLSVQLYNAKMDAFWLERKLFNMESEMRIQKGKCR